MSTASNSKPGLVSRLARPMLAGALAASGAAPVLAATDVFLQLDGIPGESTDAKHKDWIEIRSYSQGFSNTSTHTGGGGGAGKVSCGDVSMMKGIDKASPLLLAAVMTGKHIAKGTLAFRSISSKTGDVDYYTVVFDDVLIDSVQHSDSSGDAARVTESVSLNAQKYSFSYRTQKADGSYDPAKTFGYDCVANKSL